MILLMVSTILASVALGVALAYGFCSGVLLWRRCMSARKPLLRCKFRPSPRIRKSAVRSFDVSRRFEFPLAHMRCFAPLL